MHCKSKKLSRSKHQHWVPQFYLRYFSTEETRHSDQPRVWIFSKDTAYGDETLTNVRNVCGKRYLYAPIQSDGNRDWALDERLDDLESTLGQIWPQLAEGYIALDDEGVRKGLALFVAVMHLRNPEIRAEIECHHATLVKLFESAPKLPDGAPAVDSLKIKDRIFDIDLGGWQDYKAWGKNEHDQFFSDLIQSEAKRLAEMLLPKRWSVVCTDKDIFITTDKPVGIQHQSRSTVGFGTEGAIVTFPLSPKRLLIMDDMHSEPANQYYPLKDSIAGAFNLLIWRNASRFLITGRRVSDVLNEFCQLDKGA